VTDEHDLLTCFCTKNEFVQLMRCFRYLHLHFLALGRPAAKDASV